MTDASTDTTKPQRAQRTEQLPLPPTDPHDKTDDGPPAASEAVTGIAIDQHVDEPDPYAELKIERPAGFVREPFGEPHLKLQAPARPGYRRYWFNDEPGRIGRAIAAGYSFVKVDGRNTRNVVGRARNGQAQVGYLMEIPEEWFLQDIKRQQAKVDDIDAAIKGGDINKDGGLAPKDGDNRYVPKDGIRYDPRRTAGRDD